MIVQVDNYTTKYQLTSTNNYSDMAYGIAFICFGIFCLFILFITLYVVIRCTYNYTVYKPFKENKTQMTVDVGHFKFKYQIHFHHFSLLWITVVILIHTERNIDRSTVKDLVFKSIKQLFQWKQKY
ncbi:unnamed protein product [Rotaria socialis]